MNRFFIDAARIRDSHIDICGEDAVHILRVLRLGPGDPVELCDGAGTDYSAIIIEAGKDGLRAKLREGSPSKGEPKTKVTLYQGIPKGPKMDIIIQKCVELGIYRIVPLDTARTITNLSEVKKADKRVARWQKIAEEAAKQSKRGVIPRVDMPRAYSQVIESATHDLKLFLWEDERETGLKKYLVNNQYGAHGACTASIEEHGVQGVDIGLVIGPEGGFDHDEVTLAKGEGWQTITLGPRILRTETAGFATLASIMFYMGEME